MAAKISRQVLASRQTAHTPRQDRGACEDQKSAPAKSAGARFKSASCQVRSSPQVSSGQRAPAVPPDSFPSHRQGLILARIWFYLPLSESRTMPPAAAGFIYPTLANRTRGPPGGWGLIPPEPGLIYLTANPVLCPLAKRQRAGESHLFPTRQARSAPLSVS